MREEDLGWPYIYTVTWQGLTIPPPEIQSQTKTTVRKCNISRHAAKVHLATLQYGRKTILSWIYGQRVSPKLWYWSPKLQDVTILKPVVFFLPLRTWNLTYVTGLHSSTETSSFKRTLLGSCDVKRLKRTDSSAIEGVIAALSSRTDKILDVSFTIVRVRVEIWSRDPWIWNGVGTY